MKLLYESLFDLSRKIQSIDNFNHVLDEIAIHLEKNFRIKYYVILTIDEEKQIANYFASNLYKKLTEEQFKFMIAGREGMHLSYGIHYAVYKYKRPVFLKSFRRSGNDFENELIEKLNLKSIIIFPLIYEDKVFGFFDITHADEVLVLTTDEYLNLNIFLQYFSQIFKNHLNIIDLKKQKQKLQEVNKKINKKNQFILDMNQMLMKISQKLDLNLILNDAMFFLRENFNLEFYLLYLYEKEKKELYYYLSNAEDRFSEDIMDTVKKNRLSIESNGLHALSFKEKRYIYLPNIGDRKSDDELENINQSLTQMKSLLIFPLIVGNEFLGTLDFSAFHNSILIDKYELASIKIFVDSIATNIKNILLIESLEHKQMNLEKALLNLEISKEQIERLNEFMNKVNSKSNLEEIVYDIFDYFNKNFKLQRAWLMLIDKQNNMITSPAFSRDFEKQEDMYRFLKNFSVKLDPAIGTLYRTIKKKKYFYIKKISNNFQGSDIDKQVIQKLQIRWLLQVPLLVEDNVIGVLSFTNYNEIVHLKNDDLKTIQLFSSQIASAIYKSYLLDLLEEEKRKVENAREELIRMNEFARQIIEEEDFNKLINNIFDYLRQRYELQFSWLTLIDKEKNLLKNSAFSKNILEVPRELYQYLSEFSHPLDESLGTLYRTISKKKHLYIKRISENFLGSEVDKKLVQKGKIGWFLFVPLILKEECIGVLALTNYEKIVNLSMNDIDSIQRFCNQIVGAIHNLYLRENIAREKENTEKLLFNILPKKIAYELKDTGRVVPKLYENATILFTDFVNFTQYALSTDPQSLIQELDRYFYQFDEIIQRNKLTKLKTIGDAYMCVGGIPEPNHTNAIDACIAALEIQSLMKQIKSIKKILNLPHVDLRIGINTGTCIGGVIGKERFLFDIWGDTVNVAQRLEALALPEQINISGNTYQKVKYFFECEYRGKQSLKNRGLMEMYILKGLKPKFRKGEDNIPNDLFLDIYEKIKKGSKIAYKHKVPNDKFKF